MKSIRLIAPLASIFGFIPAMSACGGSDSSDAGARCASICSKVTAAHCPNESDCMTNCAQAKNDTPASCMASYNALFDCYSTATFTCGDTQEATAIACESQKDAWESCVERDGA